MWSGHRINNIDIRWNESHDVGTNVDGVHGSSIMVSRLEELVSVCRESEGTVEIAHL